MCHSVARIHAAGLNRALLPIYFYKFLTIASEPKVERPWRRVIYQVIFSPPGAARSPRLQAVPETRLAVRSVCSPSSLLRLSSEHQGRVQRYWCGTFHIDGCQKDLQEHGNADFGFAGHVRALADGQPPAPGRSPGAARPARGRYNAGMSGARRPAEAAMRRPQTPH